MKVINNTYPVHPNAPHAKAGDEVHWEHQRGCFRLIRNSDSKVVFATAPVNNDGQLQSNGQRPVLSGVIAQVKSKGWMLEIS